jgi:hypothetical protein
MGPLLPVLLLLFLKRRWTQLPLHKLYEAALPSSLKRLAKAQRRRKKDWTPARPKRVPMRVCSVCLVESTMRVKTGSSPRLTLTTTWLAKGKTPPSMLSLEGLVVVVDTKPKLRR